MSLFVETEQLLHECNPIISFGVFPFHSILPCYHQKKKCPFKLIICWQFMLWWERPNY